MGRARFALLSMVLLCAARAAALPVPAKPAMGLADPDKVLSDDGRGRIERALVEYAQGTTARYGVAVFASLAGESLEDFSMRIAESWKIGGKQQNDGVLVVVFAKERKIRIEVGYGLEAKLPDAVSGRIIREQMAPKFRAGDLAGGILAALAAIDERATGRVAVADTVVARPVDHIDLAEAVAATPPYVPPGSPAFDEPSKSDFDLSDYLVIGVFAIAILGFVLWAMSGMPGGSSGSLDGGSSSWRGASSFTMSSSGSSFDSSGGSSSSSSWDSGSSSGGSFGGGGASGGW